jgi:1-aminocyclopropane-1-carboxylate deaminase/D-cysteine desulfhydrase-like pyridoxal-dependent ACC family enzyme
MMPELPLSEPFIQKLDCEIGKQAGVSISMLRLDVVHPIVSGNKWMKFDPWLRLALYRGYKGILSTGGPFSNHLHAAAYATLQAGLSFTAVVKAPESYKTPTLHDLEQWGANVVYAYRENFYNHRLWKAFAKAQHFLYVPMGGEGSMAVEAVAHTFKKAVPVGFDCIVVPAGTGTTLAGIAYSAYPFRQLLGIDAGTRDAKLLSLTKNLNIKFTPKEIGLIDAFPNTKFGKPTAGHVSFMNTFYEHFGIPLDVVYTGKMMMWLLQTLEAGAFKAGENILAVHTGGLQGNRTQSGLIF